MALPVYAEVDLLPDAPDKVELLEDEPGTASGEDTALPEQNAATPVPEAATPEPEQSAEPEQPAPTETPEPTAEPTLTPEPTATATATPVPTVTPTATPEPTEQPQKMYAAKSVDNVQAVSETGVPATYTLYYDATFSKLPTTGTYDNDGDYSIPKDKDNQRTVYYRLKGENGEESINGKMRRIGDTDYYAADVPDGYTQIVFSSYPLSSDEDFKKCGDSTGWEKIPSTYKNTEQCFYADTNDDAVYHKGVRGGYWAPKGTLRDDETWKEPKTKVVDIADAEFTENPNTKYVTSTLYDYYTD